MYTRGNVGRWRGLTGLLGILRGTKAEFFKAGLLNHGSPHLILDPTRKAATFAAAEVPHEQLHLSTRGCGGNASPMPAHAALEDAL